MNPQSDDDYLWNRQGRDDEVERLEALLAPLRAPTGLRAPAVGRRAVRTWGRRAFAIAAAASLAGVLLASGALAWRLAWPEGQAWTVLAQRGAARIGDRPLRSLDALPPGVDLRTGAADSVDLRVARIGQARLGPASRLRLERTRSGEHRVVLVEGTLWARVWAPPGQFGVRLAQAELIDLGCEFDVRAAADGSGSLAVRSGWVMVAAGAREVLVPAGARVALGPGGVPSTPHDQDATVAFLAALRALDDAAAAPDPNGEAIRRLLAAARREDAISLLSLLGRHPGLANGPLYDHLAALWPQSAGVDRGAVARGDAAALEPWWRALPYPRAKRWWLHWRDALPRGDDARPGAG